MSNQKFYYEYKLVCKNKGVTPTLKDPEDAQKFIREIMEKDGCQLDVREYMYAIYLDSSNHVKGYQLIGVGGVDHVICDPKIVFSAALLCLASSVLVTHNHPSGNPKPSSNDDMLTKKLVAAGKLLNINVTDHIVVGETNCYYSYLANGRMYF